MRPALDAILDARGENLRQARLIFDPSPEDDSLIEHVVALMRPGADATARAAQMATLLRQLLTSNSREGEHERVAAGVLDALCAALHTDGVRSALTVKAAATLLRPHLRVIDQAATTTVAALDYFQAACAIKDVIGQLPDAVLRGRGLRHELGERRHDLLLSLIDTPTAEVAA